jgi:hypothetical protein
MRQRRHAASAMFLPLICCVHALHLRDNFPESILQSLKQDKNNIQLHCNIQVIKAVTAKSFLRLDPVFINTDHPRRQQRRTIRGLKTQKTPVLTLYSVFHRHLRRKTHLLTLYCPSVSPDATTNETLYGFLPT